MPSRSALHTILSISLIVSLLLTSAAPIAQAQSTDTVYLPLVSSSSTVESTESLIYRTRISIKTTAQWRELERMAIQILERGEDWAIVLVDELQLEDLARLRYNPVDTNGLGTLLRASASASQWDSATVGAVRGLVARADEIRTALAALLAADVTQAEALRTALRRSLRSLDASANVAIASAATVDSDDDGLTDEQEGFWCTDKNDPDSDFDGTSDGDEVTALKAWMNNELWKFPETGKPFDQWPPDLINCSDSDKDSVPDRAESRELGLNAGRESTDRDKFDDGQELFGQTNCTGQGGFCSYGPLPRNEDWGVIFAEMPSWVKSPGNHPLVAAFPVPEIDVVESSLKVETVTEISTEKGNMTQTSTLYSTSKTEGTSSSIADTESWNSWQETSVSQSEPQQFSRNSENSTQKDDGPWFENLFKGEAKGNAAAQNCISGAASLSAAGGVGVVGGGASAAGSAAGCMNVNVGQLEASFSAIKEFAVGKVIDLSNSTVKLIDNVQTSIKANFVNNGCIGLVNINCGQGASLNMTNSQKSQLSVQNSVTQDSNGIGEQQQYVIYGNPNDTSQGDLAVRQYHQIVIPMQSPPTLTRTATSGRSSGGSHTTTHGTYEEHTVTNGEQFTSGENWSTATAINSAHAAELTFSYKVKNNGTEYAREIRHLAFNIYIGDDPNPACTYYFGTGQCGVKAGDGVQFANFMPNEEKTFTSAPIPLSLEQMKSIDLGGPIRIVVEDFTYGIDELFYQDAANAGLLIALEDGTDDGDEAIDTYLIPTWGSESVLDVLARYFPHQTDANGTIIAIWTPEYRSDTPGWCQSPWRPADQPSKTLWCKHTLSTADWWNVYTDGLGNGSEGFQDTAAVPGSTALFRFNKDSDLDGFSDRSEARLGTDPNDASSFPHPELLAGVHSIRNSSKVTSTLSLLNRGVYDAYGVEAVMVAPDDSISIDNNTVGGSGRVRALKQVIVGSRNIAQNLLNTPWTQTGHAQPALAGYYTGSEDRTYTFTVNCGLAGGCKVGEDSWTLNWSDGKGNSGSLPFGSGYKSPTFKAVGTWGVTIALYSGQVSNGDSFTVAATTPRDTFQYTINREPHTPPLVIVSYNDPQGNHRFVVPSQAMSLNAPTDDLTQFAGEMLEDVGVEIVTSQPFTPAVNSNLSLLVNNPSDKTLTNANLFLELINISGTVVAEIPKQVTILPGPKATQVTFNSNSFSPAYNAAEDYIVMAFLTDYQGNILDTAGRPLSSFQADPLPKFVADESSLTWNFGTVQQGTLLKHSLAIANTGFGRLYTYINPATGLALSNGSPTAGAADTPPIELTLRTANLPVGGYDQTIYLATSDPQNPTRTVRVLGTITAPGSDTPGGTVQRPLDVPVTVAGSHTQGEWIEFTHTLGPDAQTLHPVKVYSQDDTTLFGVGKYATDFGQGTASAEMFGTGADGDLVISSDITFDAPRTLIATGTYAAGQNSVTLSNAGSIEPGDELFLYQVTGAGAGNYEFSRIAVKNGNQLILQKPLQHTYLTSDSSRAQAVRVPNYRNVTVTSSGRWRAPSWTNNEGGLLIFRANGNVIIENGGIIEAIGKGFRGGYAAGANSTGVQGEGIIGAGTRSTRRNANGGGGGEGGNSPGNGEPGSGGGGGGSSTLGVNGWSNSLHTQGGQGGDLVGEETLLYILLGGGGGQGGGEKGSTGSAGGDGGGVIIILATEIVISGTLTASGKNGNDSTYPANSGAGGAGGSVKLQSKQVAISGQVLSNGGIHGTMNSNPGWGESGDGSEGRIRIEYCESLSGTTNPPASTQKLNCYIVEQVETSPYTTARLNLPETFANGPTYNVRFGRKLDFAGAGNQLTMLRLPAGMVGSAKFDLLVSGMATTSTVSIDIGDDGTVDWNGSFANNNSPASPELADAFNAYWAAHGAPASGTLDVPVRVTSGAATQIIITNLQLSSAASRVRHIPLPARNYTQFLLDFTVGDSGSVVAALDIGDNGSIDWSTPAANIAPARWKTGDLKAALNSYLSGKSGDVTVPIRFYVSPSGSVKLNDYSATFTPSTDVSAFSLTASNVQQVNNASASIVDLSVQEGETVPLNATINNPSSSDSGPLTAAFFAYAEGWGDWYIGSSFVSNIAAGGSAQFSTEWNTTGFGSDKPVAVKVVVNPYGRTGETNYQNNSKETTVTVIPNQVEQTLSFAVIGTKLITDSPVSLVASASSGLTVTFASLTTGVCTVSGSNATLSKAGTCTIQATQAGNTFFKSVSAKQSFTVKDPNKSDQVINFTQVPAKTYGDPSFTLSATASSGLAVSFASDMPQVCTVNGNKVTIVAAGDCTIVARQNGNDTFNRAADVSQTIAIQKATQSINFTKPVDQSLSSGSFTLVATASSGLAVSFTSQTHAICIVSNSKVTLLKTGSCSIQAAQAGSNNYKAATSVTQSFAVVEGEVKRSVYLPLVAR